MSLLTIESLFSNHSLFEILEVLAVEESEKWGFDQDKENSLSYGKILLIIDQENIVTKGSDIFW